MAQNPLLGSRISLISKKNIRYEGTLYSINETDATVALQGVRAYGTEGRETEAELFLPPQDTVHPYLLFRGCDIKDLHVHEQQSADDPDDKSNLPSDPAIVSAERPKTEEEDANTETAKQSPNKVASASSSAQSETARNESNDPNDDDNDNDDKAAEVEVKANSRNDTKKEQSKTEKDSSNGGDATDQSTKSHKVDNNRSSNNRRKKNHSSYGNNNNNNNNNNSNSNKPKQMVGSGASLLRRKARGVVDGENGPKNPNEKNFDFESNLAEFTKSYDDENGDEPDSNEEDDNIGSYEKNDFFDSISCDVSDRQNGVDNRLRGKAERSLNTETFGATSLGYGRRNNRRYRGRGGGGRGRGRGSSGGIGGGGRGRVNNRPRENNRWKEGNERHQSKGGRGGSRRTYGDGGLSANGAQ